MSTESYAADNVIEIGGTVMKVGAVMSLASAKIIAGIIEKAIEKSKDGKGRDTLTELIESRRELRVFPVFRQDIESFRREAFRQNLRYCILNDNASNSDVLPLIVLKEDENRMNRIYEKLHMYEYKSFPTLSAREKENRSDTPLSGKETERRNENENRDEHTPSFSETVLKGMPAGLAGKIVNPNRSEDDYSRYEGDRIDEISSSRESVRAAMEKLRKARDAYVAIEKGRDLAEAR